MSARDDYTPHTIEGGQHMEPQAKMSMQQWGRMCDEIDKLRALAPTYIVLEETEQRRWWQRRKR